MGTELDDVIGHKTLRRDDGTLYHEPLTRAEGEEILRRVRESETRRKELMPDERAAILMFFEAWLRLKELGWSEAMYCPKDGSRFEVIEAGSTGIHPCYYSGDWPKGTYWISDGGDEWPSHPVLFRMQANA